MRMMEMVVASREPFNARLHDLGLGLGGAEREVLLGAAATEAVLKRRGPCAAAPLTRMHSPCSLCLPAPPCVRHTPCSPCAAAQAQLDAQPLQLRSSAPHLNDPHLCSTPVTLCAAPQARLSK